MLRDMNTWLNQIKDFKQYIPSQKIKCNNTCLSLAYRVCLVCLESCDSRPSRYSLSFARDLESSFNLITGLCVTDKTSARVTSERPTLYCTTHTSHWTWITKLTQSCNDEIPKHNLLVTNAHFSVVESVLHVPHIP